VCYSSGIFSRDVVHPGERRVVPSMSETRTEARPRRWLTPVALVILRAQNSPGSELMERIEEFGFEEVSAGTLYRTLRQMEREGLCACEWELAQEEGTPARRTYAITPDGVAYLDTWAKACKEYQKVLDSFARAYTSSASLRAPECD
jgi:PadR family transcriptional regulator, regulatory protein PadR